MAELRMRKIYTVRIALLLTGILFLLSAGMSAVTESSGIGIYAAVALGVLFVLYGVFLPRMKGVRKMGVAVLCFCLMLIIPSVSLAVYGHSDNADHNEEVLIVLGAGLHDNELSTTLIQRLEKAYAYYEKNPDVKIIVSGGLGNASQRSEASAMAEYLTDRGVPSGSILQEDRSHDTKENFRYSMELIRANGLDEQSVAFITSGFHVFRAELCARRAGLKPHHLGAPVMMHTIPSNYLRELMALIKYGLLELIA
jgi:uncharacterized SAM-binding protein YcdF (DUF218 family)